jgi:hypothetical protein
MGAVPVPVRASIRDLLSDLVGVPVAVSEASAPQELSEDRPAYAATYRFDDGRIAAMTVCDLGVAMATGAAIGMMPRSEATQEVAEHGRLVGDLEEFFREVVNVFAKLLNSPTSPHVVLRSVDPVPGPIQADAARLALRPGVRQDVRVEVQGFDAGVLTVLTA